MQARAARLQRLLSGTDLVFGNTNEQRALQVAGAVASLMITTEGGHGAVVVRDGEILTRAPFDMPSDVVNTIDAAARLRLTASQ